MASRTFVVTVSDTPSRVVIEDVRSGERASAAGLTEVVTKIAGWLEPPATPDQEEGEE